MAVRRVDQNCYDIRFQFWFEWPCPTRLDDGLTPQGGGQLGCIICIHEFTDLWISDGRGATKRRGLSRGPGLTSHRFKFPMRTCQTKENTSALQSATLFIIVVFHERSTLFACIGIERSLKVLVSKGVGVDRADRSGAGCGFEATPTPFFFPAPFTPVFLCSFFFYFFFCFLKT